MPQRHNRRLSAARLRDKRAVLGVVNLKLERLRYLIRMSKDLQVLSLRKYGYVAREINEVDAMLGGWLKQQRSKESCGTLQPPTLLPMACESAYLVLLLYAEYLYV